MNKKTLKTCKKHGETKHFKRPDVNSYRCRKCASEAVSRRRQKLKKMAIEYKGGGCKVCGYNRTVWALNFHHLDPDEKDFGISQSGHTKSWEKIKVELNKCILLCHNCHAEVHAKIIKV